MDSKKTKIVIFIIVVLIIGTLGFTYAFFGASAQNDNIVGTTYSAKFGIEAYEIKKSTKLIPINDDLITKAVNKADNKCVDDDGKEICSLYKIDVVNNGGEIDLHGFIRTSNSTYLTNNLKYMVYSEENGILTPVTDVMTLSHTSGDTVYFKKNNTNINITVEDGSSEKTTKTYYVSFWLSEINGEQNDDQGKSYNCKIGFESMYGDKLSSTFEIST